MKYSNLLVPTLRDAPSDAEVISHKLMLRAGMIRKLAAGIYTYLPLGLRTIRKVETIIREEMNAAGAQELLLPIVMPRELWEESGRWPVYGKELLRFKDRHERDFCFGPTHEEAVTDLVRNEIHSYRQLPLALYQIQTKFRDEVRPRFGLMRGREFIMKDCYSFDRDEKAATETYWRMFEAYKKIFKRCGLEFRPVEAGTGEIGGTLSHEFHVLAGSGESEIFASDDPDIAYTDEKVPADKICPKTKQPLKSFRGIEVGQVFYLGTKYSEAFKATYSDAEGKPQHLVMGCYGIGVGRTAAAAIEQNHDANGIVWPLGISPYSVQVIPIAVDDENVRNISFDIYEKLQKQGVDVLIDDRSESPGVKFKDADLIGIPLRVSVGKKSLDKGEVEFKDRKTSQMTLVAKDKIIEFVLDKIKNLNA